VVDTGDTSPPRLLKNRLGSLNASEHAGVGVKELQLAVRHQVADNKGALSHSPEPFSSLYVGQLVAFGHREAEDLGGAGGLG